MTVRLTKFFAVLLVALLGASGGVASFAACPHATREARTQVETHDCCHAQHATAHSNVRGESEAARHDSQEAGCAPHGDADSARVGSQDQTDSPCAECCAPRLGVLISPALAPAHNTSRAGDTHDTTAPQSPALAPTHRSELVPTQHAPPTPRPRPHVLNSVLLI